MVLGQALWYKPKIWESELGGFGGLWTWPAEIPSPPTSPYSQFYKNKPSLTFPLT